VAKTVIEPEALGADELAELETLSENSIPNRHEIVSMHSPLLGRTVNVTRDQIYKYASVMSSTSHIAALVGVDKNTIASNFARELKMARAFAKQKLVTRFYNLAVYGNNPVDRLFALKNWAGMSDNGMVEAFDDVDEGVEFKVKRPAKLIQTVYDLDERNRGNNIGAELEHEEP
jgi:hypothetical protein